MNELLEENKNVDGGGANANVRVVTSGGGDLFIEREDINSSGRYDRLITGNVDEDPAE